MRAPSLRAVCAVGMAAWVATLAGHCFGGLMILLALWLWWVL